MAEDVNIDKTLQCPRIIAGTGADGKPASLNIDSLGHLDIIAHAHAEGGHVHFEKDYTATGTYYGILIDRSDTTNYPHDNGGVSGWLHTANMVLSISGNNTSDYILSLGFLENVGSVNSQFNHVFELNGNKTVGRDFNLNFDQSPEAPRLRSTGFLGKVTTETGFNNITNLVDTLDPDNATKPCGDGDMVFKLVITSGEVDIDALVGYHSHSTGGYPFT